MQSNPAAKDETIGHKLSVANEAISRGDVARAISIIKQALEVRQDHSKALYMLGQCHLQEGQPDAALPIFLRLTKLSPDDSLVFQELGRTHAILGTAEAAIHAYEHATRLNPALLESWQELAVLCNTFGHPNLAATAGARANYLKEMPKDLRAVASLLHQRKFRKADTLCRDFLKRFPKNTEGMRLLANIGLELNIVDDAEFLLESALAFQPGFNAARFDYVTVLRKRQKFGPALEQIEMLLKSAPDNELYRSMYASICLAVGKFDESLETYGDLVDKNPKPATYLHQGHALKTIGRQEDAIESYRQAARLKPDFGDAFWSLGNLKTYEFQPTEIQQMKHREADANTALVDRYHLCFALGKALESRRDFEASFMFYERGNRLKKSEIGYNSEQVEKEADRQISICDDALFEDRAASGYAANDPIFIVGLPRAGSTLLEQILASHPDVDGTFELPNILSLAHKLSGRQMRDTEPKYPRILRDLPGETLQKLGKQYIESTRIYRQGAPFFTDKMPNNFRHIGLIKMILPNAKIIDARRHPMACCFSVFKQLFAEGQEFSYSLDDVARYYRSYLKIMEHWDAALPGQICRVHYEDVVADLENEVRRILDYCGLPFHADCLKFHRTDRAVRTASSEQVRQPIYNSGLEQWKNYADFLQPLSDALGNAVERY